MTIDRTENQKLKKKTKTKTKKNKKTNKTNKRLVSPMGEAERVVPEG
jgi:hypothetical protein